MPNMQELLQGQGGGVLIKNPTRATHTQCCLKKSVFMVSTSTYHETMKQQNIDQLAKNVNGTKR